MNTMPNKMTKIREWEEWKENFCNHISDWSYFSAEEELEKGKQIILHQELEKLEGEVEGMKREIENGSVIARMYNTGYKHALSDVLALIRQHKEGGN